MTDATVELTDREKFLLGKANEILLQGRSEQIIVEDIAHAVAEALKSEPLRGRALIRCRLISTIAEQCGFQRKEDASGWNTWLNCAPVS